VICPYVNVDKSALDESYRLAERNQMRRRATDGGYHDRHWHMPSEPCLGRAASNVCIAVGCNRDDSGPCRLGNEQANLNLAGK
jgi:hypothetical protein